MHEISTLIEDTGTLPQVCPNCNFVFDVVALWDYIKQSGDPTALVEEWRHSPANHTVAEET